MSNFIRDNLTELADAAFRQAAAKVVLKAKQTGTPVIIWVDGEIRAVSPYELERQGEQIKSTITLEEAGANLADLVHNLSPGDDLVITEDGRPVARLVPPAEPPPTADKRADSPVAPVDSK